MLVELKQYIDNSLSNALSNVASKDDLVSMATKDDLRHEIDGLRQEMNARFTKVDEKLDEVMGVIGDALHTTVGAHDQQLNDHEERIVHLETRQA